MPANARLQLSIEADASQGNTEVKKFNVSLKGLGEVGHAAGIRAGGALEGLTTKIIAGATVANTLSAVFRKLAVEVKNLVVGFGNQSEEMLNLADRTGFTVKEAFEFSAAARVIGTDLGTIVPSMKKLSEALAGAGDEGKEARQILKLLGIDMRDLGRTGSVTGDLMLELAKSIRGLSVPEQRLALDKLLGRGAGEQLPFFKQLLETLPQVRAAGAGALAEMAQKATQFDDALDLLAESWKSLSAILNKKIVGIIEVLAPDFVKSGPGRGNLGLGIAQFFDPRSVSHLVQRPRPGATLTLPSEQDINAAAARRGLGDRILAAEKAVEASKRAIAAEKQTSQILLAAKKGELDAVGKIVLEYQQYRKELGLSAQALRDLAEAEEISIGAERAKELREATAADLKSLVERDEERRKLVEMAFEEEQQLRRETLEIGISQYDDFIREQIRLAEVRRDRELGALELVNTRTIAERTAIEDQKFLIQEQAIRRITDLELAAIKSRARTEIALLEAVALSRQDLAGAAMDKIAAIQRVTDQQAATESLKADDAVAAARQAGQIRQATIIRDSNERVFSHLKDVSGRVFDAMLQRGESVWNVFKNAALTALREIVTSTVARSLMQLLGGGGGQLAGAGAGGGRFGGLGGLLGGLGFGVPAIGPGGTAPFNPNAGTGIGGALPRFGGIRDFLGLSQAAQFGGGVSGALGGALSSPLAGLAGIGLFASGFRRGGVAGLGLSVGGGFLAGASIGFAIGGPFGAALGAIIGTGVGLISGLIGLFRKSAEQKAKEKIKSLYGLTISTQFAKQIVEIARSVFGGNLDMAVRSTQVRELLELWAMATSQTFGAGVPRPTVSTFGLSSGRLLQISGGSATAAPGIGGGGAGAVVLDLDNARLRIEGMETAILEGARVVSKAVARSFEGSSGRRQSAALTFAPSTITD